MALGGYNDLSDRAHQKKKKEEVIIGISFVLLVAIVIVVTIGATCNKQTDFDSSGKGGDKTLTSMKAIKAICQLIDYSLQRNLREKPIRYQPRVETPEIPKSLLRLGSTSPSTKLRWRLRTPYFENARQGP
ncbi:putative pectinesterase/pectinesterase inhibitor 28 [Morella rubra]|uniref:Putative pectinesterase/pectinesterase inhibitor 28 n=1 Tax=Morella rubra TaxID=262757 RepID=A0A6A1WMF2_9ROSI|nr:putative pectinesterase/pectinesterase inhibitor 28 [Morella rubra]